MKIFRLIKLLFLALVLVALVMLFFANNDPVVLQLMPADLAIALGVTNEYTVTLFMVVAATLVVGIVVGFILEWLREHRFRAERRAHRNEANRLSRELASIKEREGKAQDDDVLALLDDAPAR